MMTQNQLENYLWGAATLLRGVIDAGDYKQYIFPLIFYKRICDVYDEEYQEALEDSGNDLEFATFAENHRFVVPKEFHWNKVREVTSSVGMALQKAMQEIEKANPDVLYGIFGDAQWTNKQRLSDEILLDLIEHFSSEKLTIENVPDDKLGDAYEYLIKKFADDSGHTAAEFYTNRTVVQLMTQLMNPQPGESVYDPTCGSGGLLLNCALELKRQGKEYRTLKLYGQEINLMTSSIARMNMFLHGIEDFSIKRGDTLKEPLFVENDRLKRFNVILANPPYSIKRWDRKMFENDPYGRNILGTPSQGCADYAFQQHILQSLDRENGRCVVLWPHGILFKDQDTDIRKKLIEMDLIEAVIGLGPNLFYNSPMESCLLICRTNKKPNQRNKILFINAVNDVKAETGTSYLKDEHIEKVSNAFHKYEDIDGFAKVVKNEDIELQKHNLNISLYVSGRTNNHKERFDTDILPLIQDWNKSSIKLKNSIKELIHE
jgi:type I restriction enzyme M protein